MPLLTKPNTHFVYIKKKVPALTYSALAADLGEARDLRRLPRVRPDPHLPERSRSARRWSASSAPTARARPAWSSP